MAWYAAHHHVGLANFIARPGEVFEADFDAETEKRLIQLGAIEHAEILNGAQETETAGEFGLRVLEEEEEEFAAMKARQEEEPECEEESEDEEEPEPMEIDPTEALTPAKKGGRRK